MHEAGVSISVAMCTSDRDATRLVVFLAIFVPFLPFLHLHFLLLEELTHFSFLLLSAIRMPGTYRQKCMDCQPRLCLCWPANF